MFSYCSYACEHCIHICVHIITFCFQKFAVVSPVPCLVQSLGGGLSSFDVCKIVYYANGKDFTFVSCQIDSDVDRAFYIAQKVAEGNSLASLVQSGWRATEDEIQRIAIEVCTSKKDSVLWKLNPCKPYSLVYAQSWGMSKLEYTKCLGFADI